MIIDKIENSKLYTGISAGLAKAFDYIENTDLLNTAAGNYEIDGEDVFAIVQEYATKDESEGKLEAHKKYLDVQYIIQGSELMGITTLYNQKTTVVNEENDYSLYEGDCSFLKVDAGMFTIFFPDDLHMPGIKNHQSEAVKKVVVKVRVS